jgi:Family of unknown function (DUF5681)
MSEVKNETVIESTGNKSVGNPRWQKGVSGNPAGRPTHSRQKLADGIITDLSDKWKKYGSAVLDHLATNEPATFAKLAFGTLPRDVLVSVSQAPRGLSAEEYSQLRGVLDLIEAYAPAGANAGEIFATIERALVTTYERVIPAPPY